MGRVPRNQQLVLQGALAHQPIPTLSKGWKDKGTRAGQGEWGKGKEAGGGISRISLTMLLWRGQD